MLRRVCIFCGSSTGARPEYRAAAEAIAIHLAQRRVDVVFGGGCVGLMGVVADTALAHGGHVIGVIPSAMVAREIAHRGLPDLRIVSSMHERKALMAGLADAFLCLPGGLGTLEEIIEVWSWRQIGFNEDPVAFLDVDGFWTPLLTALGGLVEAGFMGHEVLADVVVAGDLEAALAGLHARLGAEVRGKQPAPGG